MDFNGFIILLGGAWLLSLPFVEWYLLRSGRFILALLYAIPILWFVWGYFAR
jgi:hypothetical protein